MCDVYDASALNRAVTSFRPDMVLNELTDLPDEISQISTSAGANARIRREGTRNLLAAASEAGVTHFLAQSVAWLLEGDGGGAVADMETMVLDYGGLVLRYGQFYGPGTYHPEPPPPPRVHIDTAAHRTIGIVLGCRESDGLATSPRHVSPPPRVPPDAAGRQTTHAHSAATRILTIIDVPEPKGTTAMGTLDR